MKDKEIIQLCAAILIFTIAGYLVFTALAPKKKGPDKEIQIEVVRPVDSAYDTEGIAKITDSSKVKDFYTAPDLHTGIGNSSPFRPVK